MARYKPYPYAQGTLIPSHFASQIRPGAFGYSPNHLLDHALALFDSHCRVPKGDIPALLTQRGLPEGMTFHQ